MPVGRWRGRIVRGPPAVGKHPTDEHDGPLPDQFGAASASYRLHAPGFHRRDANLTSRRHFNLTASRSALSESRGSPVPPSVRLPRLRSGRSRTRASSRVSRWSVWAMAGGRPSTHASRPRSHVSLQSARGSSGHWFWFGVQLRSSHSREGVGTLATYPSSRLISGRSTRP